MTTATTTVTEETTEARRARLARERKQRQRLKERAEGTETVTVKVTRAEAELLDHAESLYAGSCEEFLRRALVVGSKFLANSGNRKGGKVRLK